MKRKMVLAAVLAAAVVVLAALAGCSSGGASSAASSASASGSSAAASAAASGESASMESVSADDMPTLNVKLPSGGLVLPEIKEPTEMSSADVEEAERAIRAYTPASGDSLLVNKAKEFYYYEQLDSDAKTLYDAIMALVEDPTNEKAIISVTVSDSVSDEDLVDLYLLARMAVQYDHAELFWLYNDELETSIKVGRSSDNKKLYLQLAKPYKNYEKQMTAFNEATEKFLADIDTDGTDAEIARAIHDKLVETVTYDFDIAAKNEGGLAHTAYGALVENDEGAANTAVCDGYSQAYVYLLQQCGVNAAVILGFAGETSADAGGHAWSVVELDGKWYEVDSTWDDSREQWRQALDEAEAQDPGNEKLALFEEVLGDDEYMGKVEHYLYNVTTDEITNYVVPDDLVYTFANGAEVSLVSDSVHVRETDWPQNSKPYAELMELAPIADGTEHAYAA